MVRIRPAPVAPRDAASTWPCVACDQPFRLGEGWRVTQRLGGVERLAYVCARCAQEAAAAEDLPER